jgi:hypothetical protein
LRRLHTVAAVPDVAARCNDSANFAIGLTRAIAF